jgi:hypothetical protein
MREIFYPKNQTLLYLLPHDDRTEWFRKVLHVYLLPHDDRTEWFRKVLHEYLLPHDDRTEWFRLERCYMYTCCPMMIGQSGLERCYMNTCCPMMIGQSGLERCYMYTCCPMMIGQSGLERCYMHTCCPMMIGQSGLERRYMYTYCPMMIEQSVTCILRPCFLRCAIALARHNAHQIYFTCINTCSPSAKKSKTFALVARDRSHHHLMRMRLVYMYIAMCMMRILTP